MLLSGACHWLIRLGWNGLCMETVILTVDITVIVRHLIQRRRMRRIVLTMDARKQWVSFTAETGVNDEVV